MRRKENVRIKEDEKSQDEGLLERQGKKEVLRHQGRVCKVRRQRALERKMEGREIGEQARTKRLPSDLIAKRISGNLSWLRAYSP